VRVQGQETQDFLGSFAVGYTDDVQKLEKMMSDLAKVNEGIDRDLRSLNGSKLRHRKEIDQQQKQLDKQAMEIDGLKDQMKNVLRVVNAQSNRIRSLQDALDANDAIIENQQELFTQLRGKECRCGDIDPFLATAKVKVDASEDGDEELEYVSPDSIPEGPSASPSPLALPGRFPDGESTPLRVIEDDEYVAPLVSACCAAAVVGELSEDLIEEDESKEKENDVPVPVPPPTNLGQALVRRSPRSLKVATRGHPYLPARLPGRIGSQRPIARYHGSTHSRQHSVGKIAPSSRRADVGGDGGLSSGKSDTWDAEYGPGASDYDRARGPGSSKYCPGLQSLAGRDVDAERHH
jgi:hypothetical protein